MKSSENAPESGRRNLTKRELFQLQRETVGNVVRTYINARNASEVVAVTYDPGDRSPRWSENIAAFKIDVENTVRRAFAGREDEAELKHAWRELLDSGGVVIDTKQQRCIRLLAAAFRQHGLEPRAYFANPRCYRTKPKGAK
ncbi:MAG TPA: hypothetical protein VNW54_01920 [Granulicella sp.]|nr:hypothetical protein [Granulicella sp.]